MRKAKKVGSKKALPPRRRMCGTMEVHNWLLEQHPSYRAAQTSLAIATSARMSMAQTGKVGGGVVKVAVVVHVVFNTADENISDAQVKSQIAVLNKDFRAQNSDKSKVPSVWKGLISDAGIEFAITSGRPPRCR